MVIKEIVRDKDGKWVEVEVLEDYSCGRSRSPRRGRNRSPLRHGHCRSHSSRRRNRGRHSRETRDRRRSRSPRRERRRRNHESYHTRTLSSEGDLHIPGPVPLNHASRFEGPFPPPYQQHLSPPAPFPAPEEYQLLPVHPIAANVENKNGSNYTQDTMTSQMHFTQSLIKSQQKQLHAAHKIIQEQHMAMFKKLLEN